MTDNPCLKLEQELEDLKARLKEAEKARIAIQAREIESQPPIEVTRDQIQQGIYEYDSLVFEIGSMKLKLDKCREEHGLE